MAEQFLSQLLRMENKVDCDPSPQCYICLEECDAISQETGIVEWGIRLPCSHVCGSACITTWFRSNNTCLVCRREFFPPQISDEDDAMIGNEIDEESEDSHEDDAMTDDEIGEESEDSDEDEDSDGNEDYYHRHQYLLDMCRSLQRRLGLSHRLAKMTTDMAAYMRYGDNYRGYNKRCAAVVAMFMVSHIMHEARSLNDVSQAVRVPGVSDITADHIRQVYRLVYPHGEDIVPDEVLAELRKDDISGFAELLPAPIVRDLTTAEESFAEQDEDAMQRPEWSEVVNGSCEELGYDETDCLAVNSRSIFQNLAFALRDARRSKRMVAAAIFMSSHLLGTSAFYEEVADAVGVGEQSLSSLYRTIYPIRRNVLNPRILAEVGRQDMTRALQAVPPLNWPEL